MKKYILSAAFIALAFVAFAQAPDAFNYQAIIRNTNGSLKIDEPVTVQIIIRQTTADGISVYLENHNTKTNELGLINLKIGEGTTSDDFSSIDWPAGPYFLEITVNGVEMGTSQLVSVPYALYSQKSGDGFSGDYLDLSNTPNLSPVATSGNYSDLYNIPGEFTPVAHTHLESDIADLQHYTDADIDGNETAFEGWDKDSSDDFDGDYANLQNKPDLSGYLSIETDPIFSGHPAGNITTSDLEKWNTAYGWGDHAELYKPFSYVPSWGELLNNPLSIESPGEGQLLKYNATASKWVNWTPDYLTSYTETDPVWTSVALNYYTKTDLQTSGGAQVHWNNLTNKPALFSGSYNDLTDVPGNIDEDATNDVTLGDVQTIIGAKTFESRIIANNGIDANNTTVSNLANPVNDGDAVPKYYVDELMKKIEYLEQISGVDTVTDFDGNVYKTIKIGNQTWMAENLKVTHFSDGTDVLLVEDPSVWNTLTYSDKAYCWYDDLLSNGDNYGALYTYAAAMNGAASSDANPSGVQGVCPAGWHLPSDEEWKELEMFLGMSREDADQFEGIRGTEEGGKLKETGTIHWTAPNVGATNSTGFTALPGGYRFPNGAFVLFYDAGFWWSATQRLSHDAFTRSLGYHVAIIGRTAGYKDDGISVRCVKDE